MRNIASYITEKLVINKNSREENSIIREICDTLHLDYNNNVIYNALYYWVKEEKIDSVIYYIKNERDLEKIDEKYRKKVRVLGSDFDNELEKFINTVAFEGKPKYIHIKRSSYKYAGSTTGLAIETREFNNPIILI